MSIDWCRKSLFLTSLVLTFAFSALCQAPAAQPGLQVYPAELAVEFNAVPGKLVILDDQLVFVDDKNPQESFLMPRRILKDAVADGQVVTISTSEPVRDRSGSRSRVSFRLADAAAIGQLIAWKNMKPAAVAAERAQGAQPEIDIQLQARHKHFPTGGCSGRLMITKDRIMYESVSEVSHSRRWDLSQIKQTKRSGPYVLGIEPFEGGDNNFEIQGQGLDDRDYRALVDRITAARAKK